MPNFTPPNIFVVSGKPRLCFGVKHLPALARLYLFVYETKRKGLSGWILSALLRRIFRGVRRSPFISDAGTLTYQSEGSPQDVPFHARNTQFHSVFSPKYAAGYEPETSLMVDTCLADCRVFWDVGSNWGHFSLYACSHPQFKGQVHAFEPMPETFQDLSGIVKHSGLSHRVSCHNFALGSEDGIATAALPDGVHSGTAQLSTHTTGTQVAVHAGDQMNLPDPDLIKLDVEGFEAAVLQGAENTIARSKPMIIMESWLESADKTLEPLQLLEQYGYQLFHPVWVISRSGFAYFDTRSPLTEQSGNVSLALIPFSASERLVRSPYMNLFACHLSKLNQLESMIRSSTTESQS